MGKTVNRTERLPSIRVRPRDRELVEAAAKTAGRHLTEFVRNASLRAARRELSDLAREGQERSA